MVSNAHLFAEYDGSLGLSSFLWTGLYPTYGGDLSLHSGAGALGAEGPDERENHVAGIRP